MTSQPEEARRSNADGDVDGALTLDMTTPGVALDSVRGIDITKQAVLDTIMSPLTSPGGPQSNCGLLVYGAPGVGKTMLIKAVASSAAPSGVTFINAHVSDLIPPVYHGPHRILQQAFDAARNKRPSILFLDELDLLFGNNKERARALQKELEEISQGVQVVAATNAPWKLEEAAVRWFSRRLCVPLLDKRGRTEILKDNLNNTHHTVSDDEFSLLGDRTHGFTGADLVCLARDATFESIRRIQNATHFRKVSPNNDGRSQWTPCEKESPGATGMSWQELKEDELFCPPVTMENMLSSFTRSKPSVPDEELSRLQSFTDEFETG